MLWKEELVTGEASGVQAVHRPHLRTPSLLTEKEAKSNALDYFLF